MRIRINLEPSTFAAVKKDAKTNGVSVPCWISDALCLYLGTEPHKIGHRYENTVSREIGFRMSDETDNSLKQACIVSKCPMSTIVRLAIAECL